MLINTLIFLIIGSFLLFFFTIIVYKVGLVHKSRDSSSHLKKKIRCSTSNELKKEVSTTGIVL